MQEMLSRRSFKMSLIATLIVLFVVSSIPFTTIPANAFTDFAERDPTEHKYGGTLVLGEIGETTHFLQDIEGGGHYYLQWMFHEPLVGYSLDQLPVPMLAKSWSCSADSKEWIFQLRQNVKWHDGEDFNAEDVKFTFDAIKNKPLAALSQVLNINEIVIIDDFTVKFILELPDGVFLSKLGIWTGQMGVMPEHIYSQYDDWLDAPEARAPVGTGAFKFVEMTPEYFKLEANEDYWGGRPYLDYIIQKTMPSGTAMFNALEAGEIQWGYEAPPLAEFVRLRELTGIASSMHPASSENTIHFLMNTYREPLDDINVRRAILYGIDREEINEIVFEGLSAAGSGPFAPSTSWFFNPDATYPNYDPERAEQILEDAGYTEDANGVRVTIPEILGSLMWTEPVLIAQVIKEQLSRIGVEIESLNFGDWLTEQARLKSEDFWVDMDIQYHVPDPSIMGQYYKSYSVQSYGYAGSTELDEAYEMAESTSVQSERQEWYFKAQEILLEDLYTIMVMEKHFAYVWDDSFHDFYWEPQINSMRFDFRNVWWEGATRTLEVEEPIEPIGPGEPGPPGPEGPAGPQGIQGPAGEAASMSLIYGSILISLIALAVAVYGFTKK